MRTAASVSATSQTSPADVDLIAERTIIECRPDGSIASVAMNNRSFHSSVDRHYADALAAFAALLDERAIHIQMVAGDALVFDNRRILHARTAYEPSSGRHLQGCYLDIDAIESTARRRPRRRDDGNSAASI